MHFEEANREYVRQEVEYSERMQPCSNKRTVISPAGNATLRMSRKPNYACIRGCLIAEVALRKYHRQALLRRVAESAQLIANEQSKKRHGRSTSHHAGRTAKPHIEEYGTGTPVEETS
jgi:hypothetical protein